MSIMKNRPPKPKQALTLGEIKVLTALGAHRSYSLSPSHLSKIVDPDSYPSRIIPGMEGRHSAAMIESEVERGRLYPKWKEPMARRRKSRNKGLDRQHSVSCGVYKALKKLFEKKLVKRGRYEDWDEGTYWYSLSLTDKGLAVLDAL
jgi:hypothetical protein